MPEYSDPSLNNLDFDDLTVYHEDGDRGPQKKFIDLNNEGWVPGGPEVRNDLQYPLDLGDVDLGHFVLFSVYEAVGFKMGEIVQAVGSLVAAEQNRLGDTISNNLPGVTLSASQLAVQKREQEKLTAKSTEDFNKVLPGIENLKTQSQVRHITRIKTPLRRSLDTVALYMPDKISTSYGLQYEETGFGVPSAVKSFFDLFDKEKRSAAIGELIQDVGIGGITKLVDAAGSIVGSNTNISSVIEAKTQQVRNPHMEVLFKGVDNRNFDFTFNFKPRSLEEANMVHVIMKVFKKHAHPHLSDGGRFLTHPSEFEITYFTGRSENTYLNRIARCVLKNISVDYTAAGVLSTFERPFDDFNTRDWAGAPPTNISMTLSFQEVVNMDQEFIQAGY